MIKKLKAVLGLKGILCIAALTVVALALVNYQTTLTITPIKQLTMGDLTDKWEIYVNDVDQVRYFPGDPGSANGSSVPVVQPPVATNTSTFALHVVTDADKKCAVKIELTAAVDNLKFSKFEITVQRWVGLPTGWQAETLYTADTGSTTKSSIDGLADPTDAGYIHQDESQDRFYLIKVTYSYDLVDTTTPITVNFQYTPLPRGSW